MGEGRIIIITGANSGIGKEAAHFFATAGDTVVMACRNLDKGRLAKKDIEEALKNKKLDLMELDMSSFQSISQFCSEFMEKYERLDCLVHNAAYMNHGSKYRLSPDNIELTFATNTFGPFYMTSLLLEHMKKSQDARILHASSNIVKHFFDPKRKIDFERIIGEMKDTKGFSVYDMYCQSKMALVLLTFKMAKEYERYGIKVHALQINGAKMSKETLQKVTPKWRTIARIQNLYFPPPEKMAKIYYEICTSKKYKNITGKLINDKNEIMIKGEKNPSPLLQVKQVLGATYYPLYANDKEKQEELWQLCMDVSKGIIK